MEKVNAIILAENVYSIISIFQFENFNFKWASDPSSWPSDEVPFRDSNYSLKRGKMVYFDNDMDNLKLRLNKLVEMAKGGKSERDCDVSLVEKRLVHVEKTIKEIMEKIDKLTNDNSYLLLHSPDDKNMRPVGTRTNYVMVHNLDLGLAVGITTDIKGFTHLVDCVKPSIRSQTWSSLSLADQEIVGYLCRYFIKAKITDDEKNIASAVAAGTATIDMDQFIDKDEKTKRNNQQTPFNNFEARAKKLKSNFLKKLKNDRSRNLNHTISKTLSP